MMFATLEVTRRRIAALLRDKCGIAATEFAVIAPVLLMLLAGVTEMSRAHVVKGSLESTAYSIGQVLVALDPSVSVNRADLIWTKVASETMAPMTAEGLKGQVAQVTRVGGTLRIDWLSNAPGGPVAVDYNGIVDGLPDGRSAVVVDLSYPLVGSLFAEFLQNRRISARLVHYQTTPL